MLVLIMSQFWPSRLLICQCVKRCLFRVSQGLTPLLLMAYEMGDKMILQADSRYRKLFTQG